MPLYRKCVPAGMDLMPWKLGEELKERRLMPINVLGGRSRKRRVDVGAEGGMVVGCERWGDIERTTFHFYEVQQEGKSYERMCQHRQQRTLESFYCSHEIHAKC